jgi:hypothetical protein
MSDKRKTKQQPTTNNQQIRIITDDQSFLGGTSLRIDPWGQSKIQNPKSKIA